jgi:valyl-tRNA synthetase
MSKSLGTGIDPLDEIAANGADALRFGLLAMSSTELVRYSANRVQQGEDLANKMWNASRLVLLNAAEVEPKPRALRAEDRWILSRLQRAIEVVTARMDAYDFAHASLEIYRFFWSELCDWYLEIVKPRLYESEAEASATLLHVLERMLALAHPVMPFVTEEVYGYLPGRREMLVVHPYPDPDRALIDADAEAEVGAAIELTRGLRRWRDLVGVAVGSVLPARVPDGDPPHELVGRLARLSFDGEHSGAAEEPLAQVGPVEILPTEEIDAERVRSRVAERREVLRSEVERAERRLSNEGFISQAPADVVEAERAKLAAYRAELEELDER